MKPTVPFHKHNHQLLFKHFKPLATQRSKTDSRTVHFRVNISWKYALYTITPPPQYVHRTKQSDFTYTYVSRLQFYQVNQRLCQQDWRSTLRQPTTLKLYQCQRCRSTTSLWTLILLLPTITVTSISLSRIRQTGQCILKKGACIAQMIYRKAIIPTISSKRVCNSPSPDSQ